MGERVKQNMKYSLVRKPGAGKLHARFDERDVKTEHGEASEAPATERAGNRYAEPITTASHLDSTTGTGTLTDITTLSSPSTVTSTDSGVVTEGTSDIVSSGTPSSSMYETSSDNQSVSETGTLTSTQTGTQNETNSSDQSSASLTTTSTLTDRSNTNSGGSATQTQTDAETLGSGGTVSGGSAATSLWSSGSDSYSLYETGNETYSSSANQAQGVTEAYSLNDGYTGTGVSTLTTTSTATLSSTQTATTTLGSNAVITGGSSTSSLCETGSDSLTSGGSGTKVRQFVFATDASGSSTYTTTYSSLDDGADTSTETTSEVQSFGTNGAISSGQNLDTLTSFGTGTLTYSENGNQTISWGSTDSNTGSYSDTETTSESSSLSDYTSISVGSNGTIAGGTVTSLTTQTMSDSQSSYENGTEYAADPEGGPAFYGAITQSSITTAYTSTVNQGGESLGTNGAISGGANSFTFIQNDYDSQSETFAALIRAGWPDQHGLDVRGHARHRDLRAGRIDQRRLGLVLPGFRRPMTTTPSTRAATTGPWARLPTISPLSWTRFATASATPGPTSSAPATQFWEAAIRTRRWRSARFPRGLSILALRRRPYSRRATARTHSC